MANNSIVTADDILYDDIPKYLINARKTLIDVESIFKDPNLSVGAKKEKIAHLINE